MFSKAFIGNVWNHNFSFDFVFGGRGAFTSFGFGSLTPKRQVPGIQGCARTMLDTASLELGNFRNVTPVSEPCFWHGSDTGPCRNHVFDMVSTRVRVGTMFLTWFLKPAAFQESEKPVERKRFTFLPLLEFLGQASGPESERGSNWDNNNQTMPGVRTVCHGRFWHGSVSEPSAHSRAWRPDQEI